MVASTRKEFKESNICGWSQRHNKFSTFRSLGAGDWVTLKGNPYSPGIGSMNFDF
jgi:hypothetical protein